MGEVRDVHQAEDQREADRDQSVEQAHEKAARETLDNGLGCQKSVPRNALRISAGAASSVIARSPCDEAIQTVSVDTFLDCFASLAMTTL